MGKKPPLSEVAVATVRRYCQQHIPPELRDQIRLDVETRGQTVTIFECRPPWREAAGSEWSKMKTAQFRFDPDDSTWTLYWADRNGRWLLYDDTPPARDIGDLLRAVDEDRWGCFWG